jgi:crotonobetainyl-CoA:carnitine CoA-transferase CaiB-like acyl-CoA transferase
MITESDEGASGALEERVVGAVFAQVNRGKKSIGLDYSTPRGRGILYQLAKSADIIVESFRPGALARRGLDYESLRSINDKIIYCSLSGYGQEGVYRDRAAHDLNYIAFAGILGLNATPETAPVAPPVQIADMAGGMDAAMRILAALVERSHTGAGQYLDVALVDAPLDWMRTVTGAHFQATQHEPERGHLWLSGAYPCYGVYDTSDGGFMSLGALEPQFWERFCEAVERPDLAGRQFDASAIPVVHDIFQARPRAEWVKLAQHVDCCLEPCLAVSEALSHPQSRLRMNHQDDRRVPLLGEDTVEVLASVGLELEQINELRTEGIVA